VVIASMNAERQMLADAALALCARMRLDERVEALQVDLTDERSAEALRRWLDEVRPEALLALRRLL
jgi:type II secretory pathway component PulM